MDPGGTCSFLRPSLQRAEPGLPGRAKSGRPLVAGPTGLSPGTSFHSGPARQELPSSGRKARAGLTV